MRPTRILLVTVLATCPATAFGQHLVAPVSARMDEMLETGGTPRENAAAQADSWPRVLRFLSTALRR